LKVKLKLSEGAKIPSKAHSQDAGFDLTALSKDYDDLGNIVYGTGVSAFIPEGYAGFVFPRSSISSKTLCLANSVAVIDSHYIGEIKLKFKPIVYFEYRALENEDYEYEIGDRIAQLIILPLPTVELEIIQDLPLTDRGENGFGSTN